jgi:hypothetical protein
MQGRAKDAFRFSMQLTHGKVSSGSAAVILRRSMSGAGACGRHAIAGARWSA